VARHTTTREQHLTRLALQGCSTIEITEHLVIPRTRCNSM